MSDEPELRSGPPWAMEEMIRAQLGLPGLIVESSDAQRLAARIEAHATGGGPILFTGCGTSEHAARAAQAIVRESFPDAALDARDAFEARLSPRDRGLVVAFSHEAGTQSTLAAAQGAVDAGAEAVLVTAHPDRVPAGLGAVATPLHDRSWCHTVAYVSPLLVHALFAGLSAERASALIARALDAGAPDATGLAACRRLLVVGSGVDEISASELALKLEEATFIPTTPLGVEKVLHGHLPAADQHTGLILLRFDPSHAEARDARSDNVAAAAKVLGMPTVTLTATDITTRTEALLAGALALQLLTLELCMALGTNPDLIRRDEPLYREAAAAASVG
jgi:glucosamine--fructose-6-phosphate aminotransferase (isomerizing)